MNMEKLIKMSRLFMIMCSLTQRIIQGIKTTGVAVVILTLSAQALLADAIGYKVIGSAGLQISVTGNTASMTIIATDAVDCAALGNGVAAITRICEKMEKDGVARLNFSGTAWQVDAQTLEGRVSLPDGGVPVDLRLLTSGSQIAIAQVSTEGGPFGSILTVSDRGQYEQLVQTTAGQQFPSSGGAGIVGYRLGAYTVAEVGLTPREFGQSWQVRFRLDAKVDEFGYDTVVDDCYRTVSRTDYLWSRQCEKATKDGEPFEVTGLLRLIPGRRNAFSGLVSDASGNWTWQMMVVNPTGRRFDVAISERQDADFLGQYQLLEFDTMARPLPQSPPDPVQGRSPDGNWRLPQEELASFGFDLEASLASNGDTINGNAVLWFRAETDQISGFCPSTQAMLQICERIQKDGPLEMNIALTERFAIVSDGWRGTATPVGWGFGPYEIDFFKGESIADWGAQEAQSWYMRFRTPGVPPGSEDLAWIKLVTMDRPPVTVPELEARGTYDRPAVAPPPIPAMDQPQPASPSGAWAFGGSDIWPDSTTVIRAAVKGPGEYFFDVTSDASGQPILRIPAFEGCYQQGVLCQLFRANPGTYPVSRVASGPSVMIGQFNVAGDLFSIRLERGQGDAILTYISRIEMATTMELGPAQVESP